MFSSQPNARIELVIASGFAVFGVIIGLSILEWLAYIFCCGMVFSAEAFNTAIEELADSITSEQNPGIGKVKDIAAGAVLISALVAAAVGLWIVAQQW